MPRITKETKQDAEFSGKLKEVSEERVYAFSGGRFSEPGWPKKNLHTDLQFARDCGLQTRSVSGTQYMSYLVDLMIDLFGDGWLSNGKMILKFIVIVEVGTKVVPKAIIRCKTIEGSLVKIDLDLWCENQYGNKIAIGTAVGFL